MVTDVREYAIRIVTDPDPGLTPIAKARWIGDLIAQADPVDRLRIWDAIGAWLDDVPFQELLEECRRSRW
jgi:hypothetical protein